MRSATNRNGVLDIAALLVVLGSLVAMVWRWGVEAPASPITGAGLVAGFRLVQAGLVFWCVGAPIVSLAHRWCGFSQPVVGSPLGWHILALVCGQLSILVMMYGHSFVSGLLFLTSGYQIPLYGAELVFLWGAVLFLARRCGIEASTPVRASIKPGLAFPFLLFIIVLVAAFVPVALHDVPRDVALSSDPDQHAFWASQIMRLRGVPWDQGLLGVGPFGYPAGFAALNAAWSLFSGLSPVEIVTVQPSLQFIIAGFLCVTWSEKLVSSTTIKSQVWAHGCPLMLCLATLSLYWFVLPYGLQNQYRHGEGAARVSTTTLYGVAFLAWLSGATQYLNNKARVMRLVIMALALALAATFNPISAIIPSALFGMVFLSECARSIKGSQPRETLIPPWHFIAVCMIGLVVTLADPYYAGILRNILANLTKSPTDSSSATVPGVSLALPSESFLPWLFPSRVVSFLFAGTLPSDWISLWLILAISFMLAGWFMCNRLSARRFLGFLFALSIAYYAGLMIPRGGSPEMPIYLLQPYYLQSTLQIGAVAGVTLFVIFLSLIVHAAPRVISYVLSALLIWCVSFLSLPPSGANSSFNTSSRANYCGSLGCASASDHAAIDFIKAFGANIINTYPNLTYQSAPKILILGHPTALGGEKWVFPYGASRLVPLESPLPVAFFYGRGYPAWDFDNYLRHVCSRFDMDWMRRHNIRYLFLPSSGGGCLRGRQSVIASSTVLFEQGGARFLKLF